MKRVILLIIGVFLLTISSASAVWDWGAHDAGLLYLKIENCGRFGYENQGIWPKGTIEHYIFGAGIWVGALSEKPEATTELSTDIGDIDTIIYVTATDLFGNTGVIKIENELIHYNGKTDTSLLDCTRGFVGTEATTHYSGTQVMGMLARVTIGYNPSNTYTEFVPGDLPNEPGYTDALDRIYFSDNPSDLIMWPLRDAEGNPIIISNQDSYCIFNDEDSTRHTAEGKPLNIKVIQIGYSWYYTIWEDFIFLTYFIVNDSPDTLFHMYVAACCDPDVGEYADDLVGFDAGRDLGYAYDSDFHEEGWGRTPGYIGYDFLESPVGADGEQLGLTAFKILRNPGVPGPGTPDPGNDDEAYQVIAGYTYPYKDHPKTEYHPFDSITDPTDVRFLQCTGPFNLTPYDTAKVVIAIIVGADLSDLEHNSDVGQDLYDIGFATHSVKLFAPNGGEEIDSTFTIEWDATSVTGNPLTIDLLYSRDGGKTWTLIDTALENTGSYDWNTLAVTDGTRYKVEVFASDGITIGADISDTTFTINNPGNGVPDVIFQYPQRGEISGTFPIRWWAQDADHDTLSIDIFYSKDEIEWLPIAINEENDGTYLWNTYLAYNGDYRLKVVAHDADTSSFDMSDSYVTILNDHKPAAPIIHSAGGCNSISIQALEYIPANYTGHQYEIRFNLIQRAGTMDPLYTYDLYDATIDSFLLEAQPLSTKLDGELYVDYSPIVDGFVLELDTQVDGSSFRFTDFYIVKNVSGFNGRLEIMNEDTMGTAVPPATWKWAFRGSDYELHWIKYPEDTTKVTLEVHDITNDVLVPFSTSLGDNWFIGSSKEVLDPATDKRLYLCGSFFWFNKDGTMTVPPDAGDVWKITSSGSRVPCDGNVYAFATVGVAEVKPNIVATNILYQSVPNPFNYETIISYSVSSKKHVVLKIYDVTGRVVRTLVNDELEPGIHTTTWDGKDDTGHRLPSGVYFCRLEVGNAAARKLVLIR